MKLALILAAVACAAEPGESFPIGFLGQVSPRVAVEARRLGIDLADVAPEGAASISAASPSATGGEMAAEWSRLRLEAARAAASGSRGFYLRLPVARAGRELLDYPEEWQAPARVLRELTAMRPVLERGTVAPLPFAAPQGVLARAWRHRGRLSVVLVNASGEDAAIDASGLLPYRALFEVRSDAREALTRCGSRSCLPAGRALWLEGRLL